MFNRVIVTLDGSEQARRALPVAIGLAQQCDAVLEVLEVIELGIEHRMERIDTEPLPPTRVVRTVRPMVGNVACTIAVHFQGADGAALVMSSAGHGRSQSIFGSVAAEVLAISFGPVFLVGPHVTRGWVRGRRQLVIPLDGSPMAEQACGLGIALSTGLGLHPWVVAVDDPHVQLPGDVVESGYPARVAASLAQLSKRPVDFEVLRGADPAESIATYADLVGARLIVASTHGRTGHDRLRFGSVASNIVRHATCPVVLVKPPALASELARVDATLASVRRGRQAGGDDAPVS